MRQTCKTWPTSPNVAEHCKALQNAGTCGKCWNVLEMLEHVVNVGLCWNVGNDGNLRNIRSSLNPMGGDGGHPPLETTIATFLSSDVNLERVP